MKKREVALRYSVPQKYDSAPYMTVIKVVTGLGEDEETYRHYIQASSNEEKSQWLSMGDFLEAALEKSFTDDQFIKEVSLRYEMEIIKKKSFFKPH